MPSHRGRSPARKSKQSPEVLQHLGRAALAYSLKKLSEKHQESSRGRQKDSRSSSRHRKSSKRRGGHSSTEQRDGSRGGLGPTRSDSSDLHHLISQLAVGALAFGVRQYMHRRREQKKTAAAAAAPLPQPSNRSKDARQHRRRGEPIAAVPGVDPELSSALDSLRTELEETSESIRRLAYTRAPASHKNCEVHTALVADADRLQGSIARIHASVNNMKNLHPALSQHQRRREGDDRGSARTERSRGQRRSRKEDDDREDDRRRRRDDDTRSHRRYRSA
ncbi:hypothetical protein B0H63DRAFT_253511 [Podospora didyma]|uniref:Uncharacterized protein n=1 Tax=Podospora didyma TaxID=330526 RepID=A0AAE0KD11_9PEZI|nr:hypothetical protein B0H63DRAFT_253511 [Podospora didyma]